MNQSPFPTLIRPFYRILDGDNIEELEERVTAFMQEFDTDKMVSKFVQGPQKIVEEDDEYWVQAMLVEKIV